MTEIQVWLYSDILVGGLSAQEIWFDAANTYRCNPASRPKGNQNSKLLRFLNEYMVKGNVK